MLAGSGQCSCAGAPVQTQDPEKQHNHEQLIVCLLLSQIGAALAYYETGAFAAGRCGGLLLGSICIIAWLNLR